MDGQPTARACAIVYDFDGTLAAGDCAQHGLMPAIGINDIGAFWQEVKQETRQRDGDEILTYLGLLARKAKRAGQTQQLSASNLRVHGRKIPLFPGVVHWFDAINRYAQENGLALSHYIVSSGLEEMIAGTPIAKHFARIFACRYHQDSDTGAVKWPAVAINYTTKTQYLFRINKGIENCWDNDKLNRYVEQDQRPFPFSRMIYLGDGDTDIPSMKMVKMQGGCSIAVFDPNRWSEPKVTEKIQTLISEDRVSHVVPGNYGPGTQLDVTVRGILKRFARGSVA